MQERYTREIQRRNWKCFWSKKCMACKGYLPCYTLMQLQQWLHITVKIMRSFRFEPLHDVGKHIENILNGLPSHLTSEEANIVKEVKILSLGGQDTKRTFDYRCTLITLAKHLYKYTTSKYVLLLLHTMVDVQRIAYSSDKDRTPKSVLRLHNMTWYHGILCREVFGFKLK